MGRKSGPQLSCCTWQKEMEAGGSDSAVCVSVCVCVWGGGGCAQKCTSKLWARASLTKLVKLATWGIPGGGGG
jgi:hypothetical protein